MVHTLSQRTAAQFHTVILAADSKQVTVAYAQTVDTDMVNEKAPDTPNTGVTDNDTDGRTVLGGVAVILAGAAIVMFSRKRKER